MRDVTKRIRLCLVVPSVVLWGVGCGQSPAFKDIPTNNAGSVADAGAAGQSADAVTGTGAAGGDGQSADSGNVNTNDGATGTSSADAGTVTGSAGKGNGSSSSNGGATADNTSGTGGASGNGSNQPSPNGSNQPSPNGSNQPSGDSSKGGKTDPGTNTSVDPLNSLTWFWQCNAQPETPPTPASSADALIVGSGPFTFAADRMHDTPVTLKGQLCQPTQMKRDIVFVIDVSGSMASPQNHDPKSSNTCGRLAALQTVLANVNKPGLTRFALVTFSDAVQLTTGGFSPTPDNLYSTMLSMSGQSRLANIVCAGNGGTNYNAALSGASRILQGSTDANTSKEIYFISDGEPDPSQYDGVAIANGLKASGVTIATLMLIGDDEGLQKISSVDKSDPSGATLLNAKVEDAAQLAATLTQLAQNYLTSGAIKYHAIGSSQWVTYDLMAIQKDFHFQLPSFSTDAELAPQGLEVSVDYWDKRGAHYGSLGKVVWSVN